MNFNLQPTLQNDLVNLKPLQVEDFEELFKVSSDSKIWEQHPSKERSQREGFSKFFEGAINSQSAFLIIDKNTGETIGTSRYHLSKESDKAVEIGWTFLATKFWGGTYNKSIKNLMLNYAFKHFEIVLFFIDQNNFRSQKAVEKIGGKRISKIDNKLIKTRPTASVVYAITRKDYQQQ